ncbi:kinase-like domain-containing protein [Leucosporidium creatinivorum]|uniref:mitogen-activated protein kinase kinase n=1 Tax=Leucosporidium creatinivorum TaxID=106004 RepID=A0A1Y2FJN7_9BASI|nr:kinase-like domain-containing protein [Leucosporidium creatinivorum]
MSSPSPASSTPSSSAHSSPLLAPEPDPSSTSTAPSTPGHADAEGLDGTNPMDQKLPPPVAEAQGVQDLNEGVEAIALQKDDGKDTTPTASSPTTPPASASGAGAAAAPHPPLQSLPTAPAAPAVAPTPSVVPAPTSPSPNPPPPTPTNAPPTSPSAQGQAPPLYPRATAPSSLPPRKPAPPSGGLRAGVRGAPLGAGGMKIPPSLAAKMAAMTSGSRAATPPSTGTTTPSNSTSSPSLTFRPPTAGSSSAGPSIPGRTTSAGPSPAGRPVAGAGGMARRRPGPGLKLSAMGGSESGPGGLAARRGSADGFEGGPMRLPGASDEKGVGSPGARGEGGTPFSNFRKIVDPSGRLNFASKAVLHADGVDFSSGASFKIKMDDFELFEELGKGNYGTVQKVWHKPTKVTMALKEIRLELDDSKLKTIITELDILHRATSPYIIDFYGAFFIESCVYYCMEYMDAQSLDHVAGCNVPEDVLARVTNCVVKGLRFLKDELKIMHRDVKPTNVLINRKGAVKLCDFGVSGQLDRSLAKTNIGCQSYMAPERIKGESQGQASSYTASSDVWSLGLSIIEFAIGHYPYPPETYQNVFAQLTAIVHGDPPALPDRYGDVAQDFVGQCLEKSATRRPNYKQLMEHPFLQQDETREVDMVKWIAEALAYREVHPKTSTPALA